MSTPAQISAHVNFKHNIRTQILVTEYATGMAQLDVGTPEVKFTITLADSHLDDLIRDLRRIQDRARRHYQGKRLKAVG